MASLSTPSSKYLECLDSGFVSRFVNRIFVVGRIFLSIQIPPYCSLTCGNINDLLETEVLLQFIAGVPLLGGRLNTK